MNNKIIYFELNNVKFFYFKIFIFRIMKSYINDLLFNLFDK